MDLYGFIFTISILWYFIVRLDLVLAFTFFFSFFLVNIIRPNYISYDHTWMRVQLFHHGMCLTYSFPNPILLVIFICFFTILLAKYSRNASSLFSIRWIFSILLMKMVFTSFTEYLLENFVRKHAYLAFNRINKQTKIITRKAIYKQLNRRKLMK